MTNDLGSTIWTLLDAFWIGIQPSLAYLVPGLVILLVLTSPLPGRGAGNQRRDPWRVFKHGARSAVMGRAGDQCEGPVFFAWGRCGDPAVEADHVYPHSKGGATIPENGQALCRSHNRRKSNVTPPWWYVLGLERRRRRYFPAGVEVRVHARMSASDWERRQTTRTARSRTSSQSVSAPPR